MADRVLGLMGPGRGPAVPTWGKRAKAVVSGLMCRGEPVVTAIRAQVEEKVKLKGNGEHELPEADFLVVEFDGKSKTMICMIEY